MLSKAQFPPEQNTCLEQLQPNQAPVWKTYRRTRHQSGTLIAEPGTCLEHCMDSNNGYTNYSCGHPISVDPLRFPLVTIHFRLNFDFLYLTHPPLPPPPLNLLDVLNEWPLRSILHKFLKSQVLYELTADPFALFCAEDLTSNMINVSPGLSKYLLSLFGS